MPSDSEGLAIARARIAEEKEKRTGFLDLGRLGLEELPEELFKLEHLWGLNLGYAWYDGQGGWHEAASDLAPNQLAHQLAHLQRFPGLRFLSLSRTDISDLGPLARLSALQSLDCSYTRVSDLSPLAGLSKLQSLKCMLTQVSDLSPLAGLGQLEELSCSGTGVSDLGPLAHLSALRSLLCWETQVSDLGPLASLTSLKKLHCGGNQVSDLSPLAGLTSLQSLDCSYTRVSDLSPLAGLTSLQSLNCSYTQVRDLPEPLVRLESLQWLVLFNTRITDIPAEVLSPDQHVNCLKSLRAHLRDLEVGAERLPDVKVLVLGNGRIGKTQICRRLRGEAFDSSVDSTHGILVTSAMLPMPPQAAEAAHPGHEEAGLTSGSGEEARLHLWDFGGQDLYHGTHALFMRTRSIFALVWTPQFENAREYEQ